MHTLAAAALAVNLNLSSVGEAAARKFTVDETQSIALFKANTPSVANITSLGSSRDIFSSEGPDMPQGQGSGIIWDNAGHVVTNYHVVKGASEVQVTIGAGAGTQYKSRLMGSDQDRDVAVLELLDYKKAGPLQPATIGTSSDLSVGQRVYAIGNPFGLDHTLTSGIISGTQREIQSGITGRPIQDVIQTDAAINPGNSGGPLLDSQGDLIGINTAIYSTSGANAGVGFAIPVDAVSRSVKQIIETGQVIRPVLGISFAPEQAIDQLRMEGVLVLTTKPGGPAALAGIQGTSRDESGRLILGDIIVSMNGKRVKNAADLYRIIDKLNVGDTVDMEVLRHRSKEHVFATLQDSTVSKTSAAFNR